MGESGSVTFVHTIRQRALRRALCAVLGQFGYRLEGEGPSGSDLEVLVMPGKGWTAVKCTDAELLCKRPPKAKIPGIALLAKSLGRSAFQMSIYDGDSISLLEASAKGKVVASGGEASTAAPFFQEEPISEKRLLRPKFYLLSVSDELRELTEDERGGLFAEDVSALLVPHMASRDVFADHIMDDQPELDDAYQLSFRSDSLHEPAERDRRPAHWWRGIFRFDGEPRLNESFVYEGLPMGEASEIRAIIEDVFPRIEWTADKGRTVIREHAFEFVVPPSGTVEQVDFRVTAPTGTKYGDVVRPLIDKLTVPRRWSVIDWQ
jgi:hypothetical protein